MSRHDDPLGDMTRFPSSADADRLLSGLLSLDDLPGEAGPLARLLRGMVPSSVDDPFTERRVVSDMAAEILRNPAQGTMPSLLRSSGTRVSAKAGAIAFAAVLATGTAAAAANGSLPAGIQRTVSDALSHVSISVPRPAPHRAHPVESQNGGTGGPQHNGGSPGGATGPVTPRGVGHGKDDDKTPRGVTHKPDTTVPKDDNGRHLGTTTTVDDGGQPTNTDNGQHAGDSQGQHKGADNGKKKGQQTPTTVTTTTVKTNNGKHTGADNGNAGGNAKSHAKQASGSVDVDGT